jgi:hypothetical protein
MLSHGKKSNMCHTLGSLVVTLNQTATNLQRLSDATTMATW